MRTNQDPPLVLLVEDNPHDVLLIRRAWRKTALPQEMRVAGDGDDAIAYLTGRPPYRNRAQHPLPALVILDLRMPTTDGYEVLKHIRRTETIKLLPVVVFTSVREENSVGKTFRLGATAYFVKPLGENNFTKTFREIERFWDAYNRVAEAV